MVGRFERVFNGDDWGVSCPGICVLFTDEFVQAINKQVSTQNIKLFRNSLARLAVIIFILIRKTMPVNDNKILTATWMLRIPQKPAKANFSDLFWRRLSIGNSENDFRNYAILIFSTSN